MSTAAMQVPVPRALVLPTRSAERRLVDVCCTLFWRGCVEGFGVQRRVVAQEAIGILKARTPSVSVSIGDVLISYACGSIAGIVVCGPGVVYGCCWDVRSGSCRAGYRFERDPSKSNNKKESEC